MSGGLAEHPDLAASSLVSKDSTMSQQESMKEQPSQKQTIHCIV